MIDICLNLSSEKFSKDRKEILKRAVESGVKGFVFTGTSLKSSILSIKFAKEYKDIACATAGVHPHDAKSWKTSKDEIEKMAKEDVVVAIGECGLDYDRMFSSREDQLLAFKEQLDIALKYKKPIFIHVRQNLEEGGVKLIMDDFEKIYKPYHEKGIKGVVHCFTGNKKMLDIFLSYGLYIGITGWVCDEKRGEQLQKLIKYIPNNLIMIETDAPYLTPKNMPKNLYTQRNEPAYLKYVSLKLAAIKDMSEDDFISLTSENVKELFNWKPKNE